MKTLAWTLIGLFVAYVMVACAAGTQVAVNGPPTAWGQCK